ncbi:MAG: putative ceramide glucosyltransferase [Candidatus Angelobacter sp.]|jgi:ceramide glucosyltransferase|nr:putative ceramide glucosyltransferase [Candidatus Angelobacter sp.]
MFSHLLLGIALIGTLASTVFLVLALLAARRHAIRMQAARQRHSDNATPGVSVLKPVHGMEPRLRENLESFFKQDYPDFELLFCARSADDDALQVVRDLSAQYPNVKVRTFASGEPPWPNAKVYSLQKLVTEAANDILVISDSDVFVQPNYLREVTPPLLNKEIGVVTCLYRGLPVDGLWARLEALGMSVEMTSGVLIADMLEGMKFALGPTMATRKDVIEKIGGVAQFGDYCSDDYLLGNMADAAGYKVVISEHVIDHVVLNRSWSKSWGHQVRWMKSTRYSRPKGHFGSGLTFAIPFGILGLVAGVASGHPWLGIGLLAWAIANRVIQTVVVGYGIVRDPRALLFFWLYPVRDFLGFIFWTASYTGDVIDWRGEKYRLEFGGKMTRVEM